MMDNSLLLDSIKRIHRSIRDEVIDVCEHATPSELSKIAREEAGDTIYAIDKISETLVLTLFEQEIAHFDPVVLIAEGLSGGQVVLPRSASEEDALWRIIVDPIDGSRGLMYQKRSGWILTGVAPNRGRETHLQDITLAVQTEIPLMKQHLSDMAWAIRGEGAQCERYNRLSGEAESLTLLPSRARSIAHGFAMTSRFFPGAREILAEIDEEIVREALGPVYPGKAHCFEDQYISTGGQLFELMSGHDRFIADIRPLMEKKLYRKGFPLGICCHPYDICTELIARELGIIVTDEYGELLRTALSVHGNVSWIGYANPYIRKQIESLLQSALKKRNLL
jgi:hypothetical protein